MWSSGKTHFQLKILLNILQVNYLFVKTDWFQRSCKPICFQERVILNEISEIHVQKMPVTFRFNNSHFVTVPLYIFLSIFSAILYGWKAIWKPTDCKFAESFMALPFSWGVNWTCEGSWIWGFRLCASCFVNNPKLPGIAAEHILSSFSNVRQQSQRKWSQQFFIFLINPLQPGVAFLYLLKYRRATPGCNGLIRRNVFYNSIVVYFFPSLFGDILYSLKHTSARKLQISKSLTLL